MTVSAPLFRERRDVRAHFNRHAHRAQRGVGTRNRIVEDDQKTIAGEMLQRAFETIDRFAETAIIFLQDRDDVLRLGVLGKGGKAAKVAKHDGDVAAVTLQELLVGDH